MRNDIKSEKERRIQKLLGRLEHHEAELKRHEEAGSSAANSHREALMSCRRKLILLGVPWEKVGC